MLPPLPFSPGKECAGVVKAVGAKVTHVKPGDRVLIQIEYGGYAQQVATKAVNCHVIPEAMSAGVLVVTSPAAATTEAITDGVTGRVAVPEDAAAWVEALVALRDDDAAAERMRTAAREWVEANFDATKNAGRLAGLYRKFTADR